jgi:epoxyqueuosine reductase
MSVQRNEDRSRLTRALKEEALRLGFTACGVSVAEHLTQESSRLEAWLGAGFNGTMSWMERNREKRLDPRILVPGATSVISVIDNYYRNENADERPDSGRISRYAWGDDYHDVMKERLRRLYSWLELRVEHLTGRVFVDSAPVMDKAWAVRAGLGWMGKHSNLINPSIGSWFFIGEMIVSAELDPDEPITDHCGTCTLCIEACPTDAITEPYIVDGSRCISYLTIEHREDDISDALASSTGNWIFGCDICQDVCPWNKFASESTEDAYNPRPGTLGTPLEDWSMLSEYGFRERFRKSPVKRTRWEGFLRNVHMAAKNGKRDERP